MSPHRPYTEEQYDSHQCSQTQNEQQADHPYEQLEFPVPRCGGLRHNHWPGDQVRNDGAASLRQLLSVMTFVRKHGRLLPAGRASQRTRYSYRAIELARLAFSVATSAAIA